MSPNQQPDPLAEIRKLYQQYTPTEQLVVALFDPNATPQTRLNAINELVGGLRKEIQSAVTMGNAFTRHEFEPHLGMLQELQREHMYNQFFSDPQYAPLKDFRQLVEDSVPGLTEADYKDRATMFKKLGELAAGKVALVNKDFKLVDPATQQQQQQQQTPQQQQNVSPTPTSGVQNTNPAPSSTTPQGAAGAAAGEGGGKSNTQWSGEELWDQ